MYAYLSACLCLFLYGLLYFRHFIFLCLSLFIVLLFVCFVNDFLLFFFLCFFPSFVVWCDFLSFVLVIFPGFVCVSFCFNMFFLYVVLSCLAAFMALLSAVFHD